MSVVPPWSMKLDEGYWHAIVTQGRWAEECRPPSLTLSVLPHGDSRLSPSEADRRWEHLNDLFADGTVLCLPVTGYNKGGLLVECDGMQGFVPISQLLDAPIHADEYARMDYLANHVGQTLDLKVIELDRAQNRIILSQRAARWGECCPDTLLATLRSGDVCEGVVSNLCDFGVFVDLGGVDGLIHVSELSWRRVHHPRDVLRLGQHIRVYVIDVDNNRRRIALSLKRLQPNPWATVAERYRPGMVVAATITNVVEFGAFARIEDGVEGLIHISELVPQGNEVAPHAVVHEGEQVRVRVLSVDSDNQRMGLSLRGIHPAGDAENGYTVESLKDHVKESPETDVG